MEAKQVVIGVLIAIVVLFLVIWFLKRLGEKERQRAQDEKDRQAKIDRENKQREAIAAAKAQTINAQKNSDAQMEAVQLVYNADEAADYLKITQSTLYRMRRNGQFPKGSKRKYKGSRKKILTFTHGQLEKWDQENPVRD